MHQFSSEHLETLKHQLEFKLVVLGYIKTKITIPDDTVDLYKMQLETAPVIIQLELEISQLEWSINMLDNYLETEDGNPTDPV
jgi:hypothetical protein